MRMAGHWAVGVAAALVAVLPYAASAASRTWDGGGANALASNPTNWVGDVAPAANDDIVFDATTNKNMTWNLNVPIQSWTQVGYLGTVTVATVYGTNGFTNLSVAGDCVISNGVWTQSANPAGNSEIYRLSASVGGTLIVGSNAMIGVTGKGYTSGCGPGGDASAWGQGSYGGRGSGLCYGSIIAPTNLGSGGWSGQSGPGGGAVALRVAGTLRNDGTVCADGLVGAYNTAGSGGSIYLTSATLAGGGTIRANGGSGGSAGGGRIALVVTNAADFSSFAGTVSAYGSGASKGCAGTIYLEKQGDAAGKGELIVNNSGGVRGYAANNTDLSGVAAVTYEFSRITLTNGAHLNIGSNDTLIVTNTILAGTSGVSNGFWVSGGTLSTPPAFAYSNLFIAIAATGSTFSPAISLTIGTNAEFRVDKPHVLTGDVIVAGGGKLTHTANPAGNTEVYKLDLAISGSLTVQTGGSVNVSGKGYAAGYGPGRGSSAVFSGSSGGYGGRSTGVDVTGPCYGSIVTPTNLGSGGGYGPGSGGGAIILRVSNALRNDGVICSDGAYGDYGRSGSGGSVYITAGMLVGASNGIIRANGGTGGGGGAGGGRVALVVTNAGVDFSSFTGTISAYGIVSGGAGTVYLRTASQGVHEGTLIIDNNAANGIATEITSNVTDAAVGNVVIQRGGYLLLFTNQTLTLSGIWSNAASFSSQWGSCVILAGGASPTSTVYGSTTFRGLLCTNAGNKTLLFEAGKTNSVGALGRLTLEGSAAATNLVLRSTVGGAAWKLNVDLSAEQSVWYVDAKDSDALTGVGAQVTAINSQDSTGNSNWRFITVGGGETNEWTGASNTVWSVRENWSQDRSPTEDDVIVIPSSKPRYPVLDAARTVNGLEIQPGASLSLNHYNLTVTKAATVAGTITASGWETVTFQTNADFTSGTFVPAYSTVLLSGTGSQSVNPANLTFYRVNVANTNGVTFAHGFQATELRCEATSGVRNVTFQQGTTVTLRDLVMLGSVATTNITLRSSSSGQKWNLGVSGYRSVRGVDVQDSDAGSGLPIPAVSSKDNSGNLNWIFGATWSTWLGTSGNNFHTAANWDPAVVPGGATRVLVKATNTMTITGAVVILDMTVGGGSGPASVTANAVLTVIEDIMVHSNGTLALNRPCVVSNGLFVLAGGALTHSANTSTEANRLDVTVYGNVGVDVNAALDVTTKGFAAGCGPGYIANACWSSGSHGGFASGPCYGSIVAPTNLGSGGWGVAGGGAIRLTGWGMIRNDGLICADGGPKDGYGNSGAGGSIWLTSGTLAGTGTIRANGGGNGGAGGGGRVALVVTGEGADFGGFTGTITTYGGGGSKGGAGTLYRQRADEAAARGTVLVDNSTTSGYYTDVPPATNYVAGVMDFAPFHVTNSARLRLTNDFIVGDIYVSSAAAWLDLGFRTLTVHSRQHPLGPGTVTNYGAIIWAPIKNGTVFVIH